MSSCDFFDNGLGSFARIRCSCNWSAHHKKIGPSASGLPGRSHAGLVVRGGSRWPNAWYEDQKILSAGFMDRADLMCRRDNSVQPRFLCKTSQRDGSGGDRSLQTDLANSGIIQAGKDGHTE